MIQFTTSIKQFAEQGEKTGWTFIEIPADLADRLNPGVKKSFRVKGKLDHYAIASVALLPMGGGRFIMALNAAMRKAVGKRKGAMLKVQLEVDQTPLELSPEMMQCLADEPLALERFKKLPPSHQKYYSNWILSAKTTPTRARRIALMIRAISKGQSFSEMMREARKEKDGPGF
jgi:hypothetical protein